MNRREKERVMEILQEIQTRRRMNTNKTSRNGHVILAGMRGVDIFSALLLRASLKRDLTLFADAV